MLALGTAVAPAVTVISNAVEDVQFFPGNQQNRGEMILNNTGTNPGRWGWVRFDSTILGAQGFTDPAQFTLTSASLVLNEQSGRNGNNGSLSGTIGAAFFDTSQNSDLTVSSLDSLNSGNAPSGDAGTGFFGNSDARPGRFGGGSGGKTNVDARQNGGGSALGNSPESSFAADYAKVSHTFDAGNSNEIITIDLTAGGASLAQIQSILADWVAGNNAGIGLGAEYGNQAFFQSNSVDAGNSVGSTIDGDATFSGVSTDQGTEGNLNANGPGAGTVSLVLEFDAVVPEPSTAVLSSFALFGLLRRRR